MANTHVRTEGIVIVLMGPGAGGDANSWGIVNGHFKPIPGNNPELRNLIAAASAVRAVEAAGENAALASLGKAAQAAMLDAGTKLAAGMH
jgi:hypothetical protein